MISEEMKFTKRIKDQKKSCGFIRLMCSHYSREFVYGIFMGLATAFTSFNCYLNWAQILLTRDKKDKDQVKTIKLIYLFMLTLWVIVGIIGIKFRINKYRKANYLIGHFIMGINWIFIAISYYNDSYIYPIIGGFVITCCAGLTFVTTYYTIVSEVCGSF